ncbi:hypothetical protein KVR01_004995 [Diaporthe batatas]|uniref:uncharacterized protein n=1 Tax=Diaporthe batatas TaxID=748121 RepID=UPI001D03E64F|nr:uncharacterized protein KVR01_004995 [Diaporthe batatas]KAG8164720.1 hypothetical protein KVR01_004995 [Diaporthe batatas]
MRPSIIVPVLGAAAAAFAVADKPTALGLNLTTAEAGNPLFDGWYADPEIRVYDDVFWIYATTSIAFKDQKHFDAFSSTDLIHWWAPTATKGNDGKYYLYFSSHNGVQSQKQPNAGLAVAVADQPGGPFRDALNGARLIDHSIHGANPMDSDAFTDDDGKKYLYFGGGESCVGILSDSMTSFVGLHGEESPKSDADTFKKVTPRPSNYVEGTKVFKRNGTYYLMWSENGYGEPTYQVAYATSASPLGPFKPRGLVLTQDPTIGVATGHNSVLNIPKTDIWYIVYHRRPLHESNADSRVVALDRMYFNEDGSIKPIELLAKDNFDDGDLSEHLWQRKSGDWQFLADEKHNEGGKSLRGSADRDQPGLILMDSHFADLVYDVDITLEEEGAEAGLTFRTAPSRRKGKPARFNGYAVWLKAKTGEVVLIHQKGKRKMITTDLGKSSERHVKNGIKYHVRVEFKGQQVSVFVDDMKAPIISARDDKDTSGQNGLLVGTDRALFDNVSIRHT